MNVDGLAQSDGSEADTLDREIGARLRHARTLRGLTQGDLGRVIDVSFQQIQKYESGANRISVSTLILLARALDVSAGELLGEGRADARRVDWTLLSEDGAHALLQTVSQMAPQARRTVLLLARALATHEGEEPPMVSPA